MLHKGVNILLPASFQRTSHFLIFRLSAALVTNFLSLFFRLSHASWLSSWLQSLCWKFGKQWKQNRAREGIWLLWTSPQCLGGQKPTRLCFCRIWRSQRCNRCSAWAWWKVRGDSFFVHIGQNKGKRDQSESNSCMSVCSLELCVVAGSA